jgi:hypothetical protein
VKRRLALPAAAGGLAAGLIAPSPASAHGLVGRTDLPIPTWLFGWAAAVVLVVSFIALATLWPSPRLQRPSPRRLFSLPPLTDQLCGLIGIAIFGIVVYSGLRGVQDPQSNLAPTVVFVHFWVGMVVLNLLLGDVFRAFNPWRALARGYAWLISRLAGGSISAPFRYPEWLGRWPAVAGIVAFAWVELVYVHRTDPSILAGLAIAYAVLQLVGMGLFGIESWSTRGDAFGTYFGLFARLSPLQRSGRDVELRRPLSGAPSLPAIPGTVALLVASIGSTSFDGASNGPLWASVGPHLQSFFFDHGAGPTAGLELAFSVGLAVAIAVVAAFFAVGIQGMRTVGGGFGWRELADGFAHTLIPIAFAYILAHYFSLLVYQGQAIWPLISDPLGHGSDVFGTAGKTIDYGVISATGIWYVQVGALVCGHVAGLILAHDRALAVYDQPQRASRSQYWMLVVMVGFTSLGLWLLSAIRS